MTLINKDDTIFMRDEKGELLPQTIKIEGIDDDLEIEVIPIPRGKLQRIFKSKREDTNDEKDLDGEIILEHCINPKYTAEEIKVMKPRIANAIVSAILSLSMDVKPKEMKKITEVVEDNEYNLKKN